MEEIIYKLLEYGILGIVCGYLIFQNREKDKYIKELIHTRNEQGMRLGSKIDELLKNHIEDLKEQAERRESLLREIERRGH